MPVTPTFIPALAVIARRRHIIRKFEEAGADRPEEARTLEELGVRSSFLVSRMVSSGVLVRTDGERYHLSADGVAQFNRRRRKYVLTAILTVLGVLAATALAIKFFRPAG